MRHADLEREFAPSAFPDRRLYERVVKVVRDLAENLGDSLAAATKNKAGLQAAWRLFSNPRVTVEELLAHHREQTLQRMRECRWVFLVQDSIQFDLTRRRYRVEGAGILDDEERYGVFVHLIVPYSEAGMPLGNLWMRSWARQSLRRGGRSQKREREHPGGGEEKESSCWVEGVKRALEIAERCPGVKSVYVADMGADTHQVLWELFGGEGRGPLARGDSGSW